MRLVCSSALLFPEFRSLGIVLVEWELAKWIPQVINQDEAYDLRPMAITFYASAHKRKTPDPKSGC